ncbi:hypothetical protein L218DRAFT_996601 [Marasmius fiardii PR-910]|nr:hypothetical protein L218DRAFT_996601 [Marasmius fiardii PR-910]
MNAQLAATILGLSLTCADMQLTQNRERIFWRSSVKPIRSPVHCLYVLSRYSAIIAQVCDVVISSIWKYKYTSVPPTICFMHLIYKIIVSHLSLLILDAILMLRIYALYNKSREMASFLGLALLMKLCFGVWTLSQPKNMPASSIRFNFICITTFQLHEVPNAALFVLGELAIQGILCWLTLTKTWSLGSFWPRTPVLVSVLNRDAISVFVAVSGTFAVVIISTNREGLAILFIQPAFISVVSCAGCRLILHLHGLGERETSTDPENITFTTVDALDTWDIHTQRTLVRT